MDSKIVAREIKNEIWPLLRREGFTKFMPKTAWRFLPEQIHVVNFQSFNSYLAAGVGCTTFSFAINLGIFFRDMPSSHAAQPQVYHCHFRHRLLKGMEQPILPRRDTWYVEPDGSNLLETLADARTCIEREALPWFDRFQSLEYVLHLLTTEERLPEFPCSLTSPARQQLIAHITDKGGRESPGADDRT